MNDEVSSADRFFVRLRTRPLRREEQFASTPQSDPDRVIGARFTLVGERNLQGQITPQADWVQRIRDVGQSGLRSEVGKSKAGRTRRSSARSAASGLQGDSQRINRVALDLIGSATGFEYNIGVTLKALQVLAVVFNVECEMSLRSFVGGVSSARGADDEITAATDETTIRLSDFNRASRATRVVVVHDDVDDVRAHCERRRATGRSRRRRAID